MADSGSGLSAQMTIPPSQNGDTTERLHALETGQAVQANGRAGRQPGGLAIANARRA